VLGPVHSEVVEAAAAAIVPPSLHRPASATSSEPRTQLAQRW
jgi:hypothetical protein